MGNRPSAAVGGPLIFLESVFAARPPAVHPDSVQLQPLAPVARLLPHLLEAPGVPYRRPLLPARRSSGAFVETSPNLLQQPRAAIARGCFGSDLVSASAPSRLLALLKPGKPSFANSELLHRCMQFAVGDSQAMPSESASSPSGSLAGPPRDRK
jgi:hypothetical protein